MSWEKVRLGEYVSLVGGGTPSKDNEFYWGGDIPWVTVKDFKRDIISKTEDCITLDGLNNCAAKLVPAGTLLFATRMAIGKVAITSEEVAFNQDVKAIFCKSGISKKYLFYLVKFYEVYFQSVASGATVKGIKINHILDLEIPLPPLPIQEKIANILDKADELRRKDQELQAKYDELAQAIFIDTFGDPVRNDKGWRVGKIRDLVREVKYGTSSPAQSQGDFPYLRMNNISSTGKWDFSNLKYINASGSEYEKYGLEHNDLVFNRTNSKELVGKTAVYKSNNKAIIAGYLIRVRTNDNAVPDYVSAYLNSKHGKLTLKNMCKNIVGMANINAQELQEIKILVPPLPLQQAFAQKIEIINALKAKANAEKSEELFQSLLQRAFKGELVN